MSGCEGGCGCGRHRCHRGFVTRHTALNTLLEEVRLVADSRAAVAGGCDGLPFSKDRLIGWSGSVGGAHQAHKAEDDRRGGTHLAD